MTKKKKADEVEVEMIPRAGTPDFEYWLEAQRKKGNEEKAAKPKKKKESKSKKQEKDKSTTHA